MKGCLGFFVALFLIFVVVSICSSLPPVKSVRGREAGVEELRIPIGKVEKEKQEGKGDPHYIAVLKVLRDKVDSWLKSLNDRIEREDITRFEVRFLEILRNILEWVKEKLDAKIESSEEAKTKKKGKGELRETHRVDFPLLQIG